MPLPNKWTKRFVLIAHLQNGSWAFFTTVERRWVKHHGDERAYGDGHWCYRMPINTERLSSDQQMNSALQRFVTDVHNSMDCGISMEEAIAQAFSASVQATRMESLPSICSLCPLPKLYVDALHKSVIAENDP